MKSRRLLIPGILVLLILVAFPLIIRSSFAMHLLSLIFFYTALTSAWNIPVYGGKVSLGHAAFFGLGGYTAAILYVNYGVSPWLGLLASIMVACLGGLIVSLPLIRLKGPFFTLASIAFAEVCRLVAIDWRSLTNGSVGINIPFRPSVWNLTFQSSEPFYYISFLLAVIVTLISWKLRTSALGYHLKAAASDDEAARALGVNTNRVHFVAFMWSSGLTGLIGGLYGFYVYVIEPHTMFSLTLFSLQPALNGIIGGLGTVAGPVIGSIIMTPLGEFMRFYLGSIQQGLNFVVYGFVLIVTVIFIPGGIYSLARDWLTRRTGNGPADQRGKAHDAA